LGKFGRARLLELGHVCPRDVAPMSMGAAPDPRLWDGNQQWIGAICLAGIGLMLAAGFVGASARGQPAAFLSDRN
jgi:hypothetical protein